MKTCDHHSPGHRWKFSGSSASAMLVTLNVEVLIFSLQPARRCLAALALLRDVISVCPRQTRTINRHRYDGWTGGSIN